MPAESSLIYVASPVTFSAPLNRCPADDSYLSLARSSYDICMVDEDKETFRSERKKPYNPPPDPTEFHPSRIPTHNPSHSLSPESIKPLIRIPNKRQTHLRTNILPLRRRLRPQSRTHIRLRNLVDGEILRVDIRRQLGFKGCANAAQAVPLHAAEEGMLFDLVAAADAAEAIFGVGY